MESRSESCGSCSWLFLDGGGGGRGGFPLKEKTWKDSGGVIAGGSGWDDFGADAWLLPASDPSSGSNLTNGEAFSGAEGGFDMSRTLDQPGQHRKGSGAAWADNSLGLCAPVVHRRGRKEADAESKPTISAKTLCARQRLIGGTSSARHVRRGVISLGSRRIFYDIGEDGILFCMRGKYT